VLTFKPLQRMVNSNRIKRRFLFSVWGGTVLEMTVSVGLIFGGCCCSRCDSGGGAVGGFSLTMVRGWVEAAWYEIDVGKAEAIFLDKL
jgi:hypothetical protein